MERPAVQRLTTRAAIPATALTLLLMALAPAWLHNHGEGVAAFAIAAFFSKLCHQHADRVLYLFGAPAAVCIRCLGIYAGAASGSLIRIGRDCSLKVLTAAAVANITDVISESLKLHGNLPELRFGMGLLLGFAAGALLSSRNTHDEGLPTP